jgi:hypothetical protein
MFLSHILKPHYSVKVFIGFMRGVCGINQAKIPDSRRVATLMHCTPVQVFSAWRNLPLSSGTSSNALWPILSPGLDWDIVLTPLLASY